MMEIRISTYQTQIILNIKCPDTGRKKTTIIIYYDGTEQTNELDKLSEFTKYDKFIGLIKNEILSNPHSTLLDRVKILINSHIKLATQMLLKFLSCNELGNNIDLVIGNQTQKPFDIREFTNIRSVYMHTRANVFFNFFPKLKNLYLARNHNNAKNLPKDLIVENLYVHSSYTKPIFFHPSTQIQNIYWGNLFDKKLFSSNTTIHVKKHSFGTEFNQPIEPILSNPSLTELEFGENFNQELVNIPSWIRKIVISKKKQGQYNKSLDYLPNGIEYLEVNSLDYSFGLDNLPNSIKTLILSFFSYSERNHYSYSKKTLYQHNLSNLPNSIEYLEISYHLFMFNVFSMPTSIKTLYLLCDGHYSYNFNECIVKLKQLNVIPQEIFRNDGYSMKRIDI